jgi:broad specificity phosphatase PhoE
MLLDCLIWLNPLSWLLVACCCIRHGQSEYNSVGKIGGDSGLTTHGFNYAKRLADFVDTKVSNDWSDAPSYHGITALL